MNIEQTAKLLGKIQAGDNREVSDLVVAEWHDTIGYLRFEDAIEAVRAHRRGSAQYLSPAHVVAGAKVSARLRGAQGLPEGSGGSAPRPLNEDALMEAHRSGDLVRVEAERAIYNRQCVDAGFPPVPEWGLV